MKKMQAFLLLLALVLAGFSATLRAEDTDIYVENAGTNVRPNILFVIDSSAAFSASADRCNYASGGAPSMNGSAAGIEQCALVDAIQSLPDSAVNMGIMLTNANGFADDTQTTGVAAHRTCSGTAGGCVVRELTEMSAAGKVSLVNFIKSWRGDNSPNTATEFHPKSTTTRTGGMMQEAWAYYHGKIGMSGTNYATSIVGTGCQKNFVIFIGNAFGPSGTPGDGTVSPYDDAYALTSAQVGATAAQKIKISESVVFAGPTCDAPATRPSPKTIAVPTTSNGDWSENWADEWARLMFQQDGGTSTQEGVQNIITYTIGVISPTNQCKYDYPALLTTMAKYGGGKYFPTGNASQVALALLTILNEVQAVNSVFSSASLPVTVNAEGTYLNQIYLGMFRPDATGSPRWVGNLKQYQAIKTSSGDLAMGDVTGQPAISSAGTGFISPNAISFWTKKDTTQAPDDVATGGFYKNDKKGVPESPYDSPDGEVVEKGGVAQQLRLESLTSDFGATAGGTTNPRRLYTYCPSGSACNAALTHSDNAFSVANAGIASSAFGESTTVPIVSIVRTGTSAVVTTNGSHGFITGTTVSISNASQSEYNVTQAVTVNSASTFTIIGLPDFPTTPSAGAYTLASAGASPVSIVSIVRGTSTTGARNSETVTVTTAAAHGFTTTSTIAITGASTYNRTGVPATVPSSTVFTFPVAIEPRTPAVNTYRVAVSGAAYPAKAVSLKEASSNVIGGTTATAHGFWVGQKIRITSSVAKYSGPFTIASVPTPLSFTVAASGLGNPAPSTGTVSVDTTGQTLASVTRVATTASATATATGAPALFLGSAVGATRIVNITTAGLTAGETAYLQSNATITCVDASCTSFTYPITVTPPVTDSGTSIVATLSGSEMVTVGAGSITRPSSTGTAVVSGIPANSFINGQLITIAASGTPLSNESAYVGQWTISCATNPCGSTFSFGPVILTPATPATGSNMQAYSGSSPPDKDTVVKWVRGADNYGDEKGPGATVTVRPSIHGDVLHSRPLVINYGDSRGIVVFYGSNDGIYRAVNGNQTAAIGSVPAGGELWGLVFPEHYNDLNRQRLASPELKFPSTRLPTAQPKDYFVDGPTGAYQKLAANGTAEKSYIYLTMRRGGRFIYALDVSTPAAPTVLWKIDNTTAGFEELGQTWSRPRVTLLEGSLAGTPTPVLIFGGGYDGAEDSQPPGTDTMGRGIYVVNALTGALIWSANKTCATSATCLNVSSMNYAIPSEIAFVDRNVNGYTDKLYFGDVGGNIWRADVNSASTAAWTVTKLAALGCATGPCAAGTAPRKFFFPPSVLTIKEGSGSYDAISIASGDREHPLKSTDTGSSYNVNDRFFMVLDKGTTVGMPVTANVTANTLFNATSTEYDGTVNGFYVNLATGEKAVNAPIAVNGFIFFATNRPVDRSATCSPNLGEAKAYAVNPFLGTKASNILPGGGLAPSAVTGLITVGDSVEKFCIGCGISTLPGETPPTGQAPCNSALEICTPATTIPKNLKRTYWYKK